MFTRLLAWIAPYFLPAAAAVVAALVGWGAFLNWQLNRSRAETVQIKQAWDLDRAQATAAALAQTAEYRAEETRRSVQLQKAADDADRKLNVARADAGAASAAAGRLSDRVAGLVAASRRAACDSATASLSAPAGDPLGMLADLLGRIDERAGIMASIADERGIAGAACERSYDALRP